MAGCPPRGLLMSTYLRLSVGDVVVRANMYMTQHFHHGLHLPGGRALRQDVHHRLFCGQGDCAVAENKQWSHVHIIYHDYIRGILHII